MSCKLRDSQALPDLTGMEMVIMRLFRQLVGGESRCTNWRDFNSPSPFNVCSNELLPWLGRLHCWYPCCVFVTLSKKALLLIVSHGAPCFQYSQPFLSLELILPLFQP